MITFSADDIFRALSQVVEESGPDFRYEVPATASICLYVFEDKPSCGVGRALHALGVPIPVLAKMDQGSSTGILGDHANQVALASGGFALTRHAAHVAASFQRHQDTGNPYGDCLANAATHMEG